MLNAGMDFDAIFIVHEVIAVSIREDQPPPLSAILPPPPQETLALSQRLGSLAEQIWGAAMRLITVTATAPLAILVAGDAVDPIIMGAVVEPGRTRTPEK